MAKTLFDRIWESHVVHETPGEPALLYVDLHLIHEVTSAQAFDGLRLAGRTVRRPDLSIATMDHNVPTLPGPITDPLARAQLDALRANCEQFGIPLYATGSGREGIVHVIGPELGLSQPGLTIVCGDSHTSTHGAFGALAFGIGTSEVEHVLATQCLPAAAPPDDADPLHGRATARGDAEGRHPRHDRPHRRRRRRRACPRVRRSADQRPLDGGTADHLQHVDRGGGARGDDRSGRHDLRLPRREAGSPEGRRTGSAQSSAGASCAPTTTPCSITRSRSTSPNWSRR